MTTDLSKSDLSGGGKLQDNLRDLINLVDDLRDCGLNKIIQLPRICVVGGQSAGKSSVLEQIVGIDFLPRGSGVCTRRPLEMRLVHVYGSIEPYAVFEELPDQKFTDFNKVRDSINELTDKICGTNKNIVDKPIILTIYSHTCPDLTLIDLPGITKVPISGQDKDIERVTKEMTTRYIEDERTIILVVLPANQDMTTSDGLQMARNIDQKGTRTIGVITKIDIMDKGVDAKKMLMNEEIHLNLGFCGVVNRSQLDINTSKRVQDALRNEKKFFATTPPYNSMPPGYLGTENLVEKLTKILYTHIKALLPEIVREINEKMKECESRLNSLGPIMPVTELERMQLLHKMITEFCDSYKNSISGKYDKRNAPDIRKKQVEGGSKIKEHFYNLLKEFANYNVTEEYIDADIEMAVKLHEGDTIPGFPSADVFMSLIYPQLSKINEPCEDCLNEVYYYLENIADKLIKTIFMRFPNIVGDVYDIAVDLISSEKERTKEYINAVIEAEMDYIFTNDWDFMMKNKNFVHKEDNANNVFIREIRSRLDNYFSIVIRNVRDTIPKLVGHHLVKKTQDSLSYNMWQTVNYQRKDIVDKMIEPDNIALERESISKQLTILKNAYKIIKKDPHLSKLYNQAQAEDRKERTQTLQHTTSNDRNTDRGNNNTGNEGSKQEDHVEKEKEVEKPKVEKQLNSSMPTHSNSGGLTSGNTTTTNQKKPKLVLFKRDNE